jgi:hypothetical protein
MISEYFNRIISQPLKHGHLTKKEFCLAMDLLKIDGSTSDIEQVYEYIQKRVYDMTKGDIESAFVMENFLYELSTPANEIC